MEEGKNGQYMRRRVLIAGMADCCGAFVLLRSIETERVIERHRCFGRRTASACIA